MLVLIGVVLVAAAYARGLRELWRRAGPGRSVSRAQAGLFYLGLLTIVLALASPLDWMAHQLFAAHMVQHLLLMLVAAPLVVLGSFTRSASGASDFLVEDLQLSHAKTVDLKVADAKVADDGSADRQATNRHRAQGQGANRRGADRGRPEAGRWQLDRSTRGRGAHGAPRPGVAEELIRRSMASSQVTGRADPLTVQKLKRVGPMRGRSLRMMARCGMAPAKASRCC